jgi:hypothetical protein
MAACRCRTRSARTASSAGAAPRTRDQLVALLDCKWVDRRALPARPGEQRERPSIPG